MGTKLVNSKAEKKSRTWLATPPTWANAAIPGQISNENRQPNVTGDGRIPRHTRHRDVRPHALEDIPRRPRARSGRPPRLGPLRRRHRVVALCNRHDKAPSKNAGGQAEMWDHRLSQAAPSPSSGSGSGFGSGSGSGSGSTGSVIPSAGYWSTQSSGREAIPCMRSQLARLAETCTV